MVSFEVVQGFVKVTDTRLNSHIPIHAVWNLFRALARAVCVTANGYLPNITSSDDEWQPLIHSDIKSANGTTSCNYRSIKVVNAG
jgi:hypothetical protein